MKCVAMFRYMNIYLMHCLFRIVRNMKTLITTASEYGTKKAEAIQVGLELNDTHSLLSSDINLLSQT